MKKFSKKGTLLFVAAMALCAFVMPSMASASSWGVVPSIHSLDSPDLGFINDAGPGGVAITSSCSRSQFTSTVVSTAVVEIHTATFAGCTLNGAAGIVGLCTLTSTATNLPWTATAVSTSNIQIHGVNIDVFVENHPGGTACSTAGLTLKITGTLTGGEWNANEHAILLTTGTGARAASGLVTHSNALGNGVPITLTGTIRDTQQTLTVTN